MAEVTTSTGSDQIGADGQIPCLCISSPIANPCRKSLLRLSAGTNDIGRGCFWNDFDAHDIVHRSFASLTESDLHNYLLEAEQVVLIIPDQFTMILKFAKDYRNGTNCDLSQELLKEFRDLPVWNYVVQPSTFNAAKIKCHAQGETVPLRQLHTVFAIDNEANIVPIALKISHEILPSTSRGRSKTEPSSSGNYEKVLGHRASKSAVLAATPRSF